MTEDSLFDQMAARVRLTENLKMIEDPKSVVKAVTVVIWFGIVQALGSAIPLFSFDEPESAWAVIVAAAIFVVAWVWLAATGDLTGAIVVGVVAGAVPVYIHVALGGFAYSGGSLFFAIMLMSVVALLLGRRAVTFLGLVYVLLIAVFGLLDAAGKSPSARSDAHERSVRHSPAYESCGCASPPRLPDGKAKDRTRAGRVAPFEHVAC